MNYESLDAEQLLHQYRQTGDVGARDEAVMRFTPMAAKTARRFVRPGAEYDDLFQVAMLALVKAADRFEAERGLKFSTFVVPTMVGEIKNYLRDHSNTVRISRTVAELALKVKKAQAKLTMDLGAAPTVEQLAAELGESRERVLEAMESSLRSTNVALDSMEEDDYSAESWLGSEDAGYDRVERQEVVKKLLAELDEQDRKLLILRYFQGKTQAEAGRQLGLTQMYISRRERKLLSEIRRSMKI